MQAYEGVCIGRAGGGLNENFTVRKISYGEGVERVFPLYSPMIDSIQVVRRGKVRRAKLYYLRGRRGKSARIFERQDHTAEAPRRRQEGGEVIQIRRVAIILRAGGEVLRVSDHGQAPHALRQNLGRSSDRGGSRRRPP